MIMYFLMTDFFLFKYLCACLCSYRHSSAVTAHFYIEAKGLFGKVEWSKRLYSCNFERI